jgi:hypothetical protein
VGGMLAGTARSWSSGGSKLARLFRQGVWPAEVARRLGGVAPERDPLASRLAGVGQQGPAEGGDHRSPVPADGGRRAPGEERLDEGARANGFSTDLWTVDRVTEVIAKVTGVEYHPGQVWKLLGRLG